MERLPIVEAFTEGLTAIKSAVDSLKAVKEQLPVGESKTAITQKIEEAEHAITLANAEMGQALGYQLCQCTWPPQVMRSLNYSEETQTEQVKCPNCEKVLSMHRDSKPSAAVVKAFDPYDVY
jgi:hypothetical protein